MPGGGVSGGAGGLADGRGLGEGGEEDIVKDMLGAHGRGTSDEMKTHGQFVRRKYLRRNSPRSGGGSNGDGASEVDSTRVRTDAAHALA